MKAYLLLIVFFYNALYSYSQNCPQLNLQFEADIPSTCNEITMTMEPDQLGRPYLYVAKKEGGLAIYNISNINAPQLIKTIPVSSMQSLSVVNISQNGNYLYLALGDIFSSDEAPGMAIIDISDPANAFVTDSWKSPSGVKGAGIVETEGNYAYLGAMQEGVIILNIANKSNITFVTQYIPDLTFPEPTPDTAKINARGMVIRNDKLYLAYDAGGFRIIDVSSKNMPQQVGQYSNPLLNGKPRAYNNIVLNDTLAYVTIDYCGLEILNIADPANISLVGWWNPWNCPTNNWFTSTGHTNEIVYDEKCQMVFMSTGKSDMYAVNVANPTQPDSCDIYGGVGNNIGTWGIGRYDNKLFLSYICTWGIPFASNWTGVKILSYDACNVGVEQLTMNNISIFPNPAKDHLNISLEEKVEKLEIYNINGQKLEERLPTFSNFKIDISDYDAGIYLLKIYTSAAIGMKKFVKQ